MPREDCAHCHTPLPKPGWLCRECEEQQALKAEVKEANKKRKQTDR